LKISRINIFGRSSHSKGLAFENLMGLVLNSLGYTNVIRRSMRPGLEIDLEADHKALNIHLLCECKAYKNPIASRPLRDFFAIIATSSQK
jgi:hypothetical protein